MRLLELQRRMAAEIMQPLTAGDHLARKTSAEYLKPNDRLTSRQRLEIYSRSYWFRLIDSMFEDFPGLAALLGQQAFHRMVRAYLTECPSRSFTMRDLGSRLEVWLRKNPKYAGGNRVPALDMVRLEWAHMEAWDGRAEKPLGAEDLLEPGPGLRLSLQPYVQLLNLQYPVDDLRIAVTAAPASARRSGQRFLRKKPKPRFVAVHRVDLSVFYRILDAEEFAILKAIQAGGTLGEALETAFSTSSIDAQQFGSRVQTWFSGWSELGWLVHRGG